MSGRGGLKRGGTPRLEVAALPEEVLAEIQKRKDDREAELRKVTALEKAKLAEKKSGKRKPGT